MRLCLEAGNRAIIFTTENSVKPNATQDSFGGIGLQNLQRRLDLLYPKAHSLATGTSCRQFKATLVLNT